jgi:hypothetical protein
MKRGSGFLLVGVVGLLAAAARAEGPAAVRAGLSAGKYVAAITPDIDEEQALIIQTRLSHMDGLRAVHVKSGTSLAHFTIKEGVRIDPYQVRSAVKAAVPSSYMGNPGPEPYRPDSLPRGY